MKTPSKKSRSSATSKKLLPISIPAPETTDMQNIFSVMEKLLHWAAIIDSSDDAIISKSVDGYITSWNRGAQDLYGYAPEEVIGKPVSILMPPDKEDDFELIMDMLHAGKKVEHYETRRVTKFGRVLDVSITVSPIRDSQGNIIGASKIARDISERVENERRRDEFVNTASHELKTPITSQKVFGELLEQQIVKNGDTQYLPYIQKMNLQTLKLEKLINDLLELSRIQTGRLSMEQKEFSLDDLIKEIVEDMQRIAKQKIIIENGSNTTVIGDRDRIGQVLTNVLTNAIKYSPLSEEIHVFTDLQETNASIGVQDFGIGIEKEFHEKIFERFFRVAGPDETTYPGMGIGLDFAREIVTRHGGEIWVESEKGQGSTFFITLPVKT